MKKEELKEIIREVSIPSNGSSLFQCISFAFPGNHFRFESQSPQTGQVYFNGWKWEAVSFNIFGLNPLKRVKFISMEYPGRVQQYPSGVLGGLNPLKRVKFISIISFGADPVPVFSSQSPQTGQVYFNGVSWTGTTVPVRSSGRSQSPQTGQVYFNHQFWSWSCASVFVSIPSNGSSLFQWCQIWLLERNRFF